MRADEQVRSGAVARNLAGRAQTSPQGHLVHLGGGCSELLIKFLTIKRMAKKVIVETGGVAPISEQYRPSGGNREIALVKGKRVPPDNEGVRQRFTLVDTTKHKH